MLPYSNNQFIHLSRLYSLRLPKILYAICKCRLYSLQKWSFKSVVHQYIQTTSSQCRLFYTTVHTHEIAYLRYISLLRLLLAFTRGDPLTLPASYTIVPLVSIFHILHFISCVQFIPYTNSRLPVACQQSFSSF